MKNTMAAKPELPEGYPLNNRGLLLGDRVRLLKLDDWFFSGIPEDEVQFLDACVGQNSVVSEFSEYGFAEIEYVNSAGGCFHFLWVDPSWLEKV